MTWLGIDFDREKLRSDPGYFANFKVIGGHFGLREVQHLPFPKIYASVLRNPQDRIVSYFRFLKSSPEHPLYKELNEKNLLTIKNHFRNQQCRFLSVGRPTFREVHRRLEIGDVSLGLFDDFPRFMNGIGAKFDLNTTVEPIHVHESKNKERLPHELEDFLPELISEDLKLYRYLQGERSAE